jgi:hypothetical protein
MATLIALRTASSGSLTAPEPPRGALGSAFLSGKSAISEGTENPRVGGSIPPLRTENTAEIAQSRVSDAPSCRPEVTDGEPTYGTVQTPLVRIANELLRAVVDGREQDAKQFAEGLAERVLSTPLVRGALLVREGGPLAVARAVGLAQRILQGHG